MFGLGREIVRSLERLAENALDNRQQLEAMKGQLSDLAGIGKDYITLRSELAASQAQLGQLQSSFTWLTEHVNRLERERAELLARVLGVSFPAMTLESTAPTPTQSRIVGRPLEADDDSYAGSIPALQAVGALFEDVGDENAAQLGARHDSMGNVTWTK